MMSHSDSKYSSYKISISVLDKDKVLDPKFWPSGIQCKMWRAPRPVYNDNHPYNDYTDSDNDDDNDIPS